jgi:hypothetical protein
LGFREQELIVERRQGSAGRIGDPAWRAGGGNYCGEPASFKFLKSVVRFPETPK